LASDQKLSVQDARKPVHNSAVCGRGYQRRHGGDVADARAQPIVDAAVAKHPRVFRTHVVGTRRRGLDTAITDHAEQRLKRGRRRPTLQRLAAMVALRFS